MSDVILSSSTTHSLKVLPEFFEQLWLGRKRFEIRLNDRGFNVNDMLNLKEWDTEDKYTGREIDALVTYMTDFNQKEGYVVMSLEFMSAGATYHHPLR